jgi:elongation factor P
MVASNQLAPGMTISLEGKIYRVESAVKITVPQGAPFIKTKLKDLMSDDAVEKSFKVGQEVQDVTLSEKRLEFLYPEGQDYLFLDIGDLDQVIVGRDVIGDKVNYLKEAVEIKALFYGQAVFSVELPQFLELMVVKIEGGEDEAEEENPLAQGTHLARLETGGLIAVPRFIASGDIIKVDTQLNEYVQRI